MELGDDSVSSGRNQQVPFCDANTSTDVIPADDRDAQEQIQTLELSQMLQGTDANVRHDRDDAVSDEGIISSTGRIDAVAQTQDCAGGAHNM